MARHDPHISVIVLSGLLGVTLLAVILAWLRSWFFVVQHETVYTNVLEPADPALMELRLRETEVLNTYGWVDQERGVVRIPIDRAMELMAERARTGNQGKGGE